MSNQIAKKLEKLRKDRNLTQKQIAAFVGIGRPCYSSYEEGRVPIPVNILLNLAAYYKISLDYFANHNSILKVA